MARSVSDPGHPCLSEGTSCWEPRSVKRSAACCELTAVSTGGSNFAEHLGEHFGWRSVTQYTPRTDVK